MHDYADVRFMTTIALGLHLTPLGLHLTRPRFAFDTPLCILFLRTRTPLPSTLLLHKFVEILVFPQNACATNECVSRTAQAVRVDIDWKRAHVRVVPQAKDFIVRGLPKCVFHGLAGGVAWVVCG